MGYYEENMLCEDSFSKAVVSMKRLSKLKLNNNHSLPISSFGMYETPRCYDIVNGKFAVGLFNSLGPIDGPQFKRFKKRAALLKERIFAELED